MHFLVATLVEYTNSLIVGIYEFEKRDLSISGAFLHSLTINIPTQGTKPIFQVVFQKKLRNEILLQEVMSMVLENFL